MKYLIIAMHGSCIPDNGPLDQPGKREIKKLAERIKKVINSNKIIIISSTARQALDSTDILHLNLQDSIVIENSILYPTHRHGGDFLKALWLIEDYEEKTDVLVLVTHLEFIDSFPNFFGEQKLGVDFGSGEIATGRAWVINCEEKTLQLI